MFKIVVIKIQCFNFKYMMSYLRYQDDFLARQWAVLNVLVFEMGRTVSISQSVNFIEPIVQLSIAWPSYGHPQNNPTPTLWKESAPKKISIITLRDTGSAFCWITHKWISLIKSSAKSLQITQMTCLPGIKLTFSICQPQAKPTDKFMNPNGPLLPSWQHWN